MSTMVKVNQDIDHEDEVEINGLHVCHVGLVCISHHYDLFGLT